VITAFETILNSKDAKRIPTLKASAQRALEILKAPQGTASNANEDRREEVFEPLKLACQTKTNAVMITALDTIGKLVSYGFFNPPHANLEDEQENGVSQDNEETFIRDTKSEQLSDAVVDAICDCFIETPSGPAVAALQAAANSTTTPDAVNLQIVKALLTLVLQDANGQGLTVHQSSLVGWLLYPRSAAANLRFLDSSKPFGRYTISFSSRRIPRTRW
jgi:brefeldin A-inhibited guanine nucleotide-exchange protein